MDEIAEHDEALGPQRVDERAEPAQRLLAGPGRRRRPESAKRRGLAEMQVGDEQSLRVGAPDGALGQQLERPVAEIDASPSCVGRLFELGEHALDARRQRSRW